MSSSKSAKDLQFHYVPTEWVGIFFAAVFGISTFIHIVQTFRCRFWWLIPTIVFCGSLEVIGWGGRIWSSQNPYLETPFVIAIVANLIAPTPLVAANFIMLGRIIRRLGPQYSRLTPRKYTIIFVNCDIISLVVQAIGGSVAAGTTKSVSQAKLGSHIALVGTIFQLLAIFVYCAIAAEFVSRYARDRPIRFTRLPGEVTRGVFDQSLKRMLYAMAATIILIIIRTIYRVAEFIDGWDGKLNSRQWYFLVFDATMISSAMLIFNIFHPGNLLRESDYSVSTSENPSLTQYPKTGNVEMRAV